MKKNQVILVITALLLSVLLLTNAMAETALPAPEQVSFRVVNVDAVDGEMNVLLTSNYVSLFNMESVDVLLNDAALVKTQVTPAITDEHHTEYLFLLDFAKTAKTNKQKAMKDFILAFATKVQAGKGGRFAARTVDGVYSMDPMYAVSNLETWLTTVKTTTQDKSLYSAVLDAVNELKRTGSAGARLCVIVVTDGVEDAAGLTQEELTEELVSSGVMVHTVALTLKNDKNVEEISKVGAWARKTDGMDLQLVVDRKKDDGNKSPEELAQTCWEYETQLLNIRCRIPDGMKPFAETGKLNVRLDYSGSYLTTVTPKELSAEFLNGISVAGAGTAQVTAAPAPQQTVQPMITTAPTAASTSVATTEPTTTPEASPIAVDIHTADPGELQREDPGVIVSSNTAEPIMATESFVTLTPMVTAAVIDMDDTAELGFFDQVLAWLTATAWFDLPMWVFVAAGAGVLLLILIICIAVRRSHKKHRVDDYVSEDTPPKPMDDIELPTDGSSIISHTMTVEDINGAHDGRTEIPGLLMQQPISNRYRLILTRTRPHPEQFTFVTDHPVTVGRSHSKAEWVIENDTGISGAHCQFEVREDRLFVTDLHSTNGTFVNGQQIQAQTELQQDQVVRLGATDYSVNWMGA